MIPPLSRRQFFGLAATSFLVRYHQLAAAEKKRVKIRDVQTMMLQGPRTYTLVKVVADDGLYGIAEAYGSPGVGVREQVQSLKPWLTGKDPLEIDAMMEADLEVHHCLNHARACRKRQNRFGGQIQRARDPFIFPKIREARGCEEERKKNQH